MTGLSQGVTYYYRVRATNLYCVSAHSTTQSVTTIVLPAPEIAVLGTNMELIADGSAVPSLTNGTDFGMALVLGETPLGIVADPAVQRAIGGTHQVDEPGFGQDLGHVWQRSRRRQRQGRHYAQLPRCGRPPRPA